MDFKVTSQARELVQVGEQCLRAGDNRRCREGDSKQTLSANAYHRVEQSVCFPKSLPALKPPFLSQHGVYPIPPRQGAAREAPTSLTQSNVYIPQVIHLKYPALTSP